MSWKVGSISSEQGWPLLSHSPRAEPTGLFIVSSGILRVASKTEYFKTEQRMKKVSSPHIGHRVGWEREDSKEEREKKVKERKVTEREGKGEGRKEGRKRKETQA